ncbi:MAG TPA: hydantoinase/oxoprolinase family protein [Gemmataceae bacterium]|nr:hydantoinase/oxoprolinase family protein [Gemmataceae bacterium]
MKGAILGLDVGGANLKAAHTTGAARSRSFALWKDPDGLADALRGLIAEMPPADALAVTMTGELCDCYETKRQGVSAILDAVEQAADGMPVRVWCNDGRFHEPAAARTAPLTAAAANWLALATFAGRFAPNGAALLMDFGSTTTDLIPLHDGRPVPHGCTDRERLRCGELVYIGVRRTPLCAILAEEGAAELFATTLDLFLLLDWIAEDAADCNTADGRPAVKAAAEARLARMDCTDLETSTPEERKKLVNWILFKLTYSIMTAVRQVVGRLPEPPRKVVIAGEGAFLALHILKAQSAFPPCPTVPIRDKLGPEISRAACAYAVAVLAAEE